MPKFLKPKGINRNEWERIRKLNNQKFPEIIVEPKKTFKNKGSSDSSLMQEMFPASPIYNSTLNNNVIETQKNNLLAKGVVDDGGHTFGKVDRNFGQTPGPIELDFDVSLLLDVTPYWQITGSLLNRKEKPVKKYVPTQLKPLSISVETQAEYEEGLVYLNNQTAATINFNYVFTVSPTVVLSVEPTIDNQSNINVFGLTEPTTTGLLLGTSAPFKGYIRYRAASNPEEQWPKNVSSIYTSSMKVYAGKENVINDNVLTSSFSFPTTTTGSIIYYATMYDAFLNATANTKIVTDSIINVSPTLYNANSHFTQDATVKIHFLAFKV